jgi:Ca-activated chloride channel family protein
MPLTDDYELAKMFLDVIDTDMIGGGGTNVGTAIKIASESFERTSNFDKVIIILSDGEEHSSDSIEVLKSIKDENLKVYTVGIGTDKGGLIPIYDDAGRRVDYKKDSNGEYVMSKLNRNTLQELAAVGKGAYHQSTGSKDEINSLAEDISGLKRDTFKTDRIRRFKQLYQYFLAAGIICIAAAYFLPEGRNAG